MGSGRQLRQLRAVYAGGVVAWTLCLLLNLVGDDDSARQTVVLLGLLAVFLGLLLWSTWRLWEAGPRGAVARVEEGAAAPGESF
ncbi:hypothetical protein NX794_24630 [Streptomyces sp. LP11]|uniref:Integral membrane protein n=1 Tax=Streptomyces pyxinicus TaxID=2970331 RepID=A0ABT2B781_9ACTN|nr:hypothetical protein [Streptomyces sp. LP11]MCS0604374.1 hypothetical protein [Streptomyces sp. LP11]